MHRWSTAFRSSASFLRPAVLHAGDAGWSAARRRSSVRRRLRRARSGACLERSTGRLFRAAGDAMPGDSSLGGYYNLKYFRPPIALIGVTEDPRIPAAARHPAAARVVCHTFGTLRTRPVDRKSLRVPDGALLLLVLSRLHPKKGSTQRSTRSPLPDAHLVRRRRRAGPGQDAEFGAGASVRRAGAFPRLARAPTAEHCSKPATSACCPSHYEPFGTVVAEALVDAAAAGRGCSSGPGNMCTTEDGRSLPDRRRRRAWRARVTDRRQYPPGRAARRKQLSQLPGTVSTRITALTACSISIVRIHRG